MIIQPLDLPKDAIVKAIQKQHNELPHLPFSMIALGKRGCGKSILITNVVKELDTYVDSIVIISPTIFNDVAWKSLSHATKNRKEAIVFSNDISPHYLQAIINLQKQRSLKGKSLLIVVDDGATSLKGKNSIQTQVDTLFATGRHYKISIILALQSYTMVSPLCRSNSNAWAIFNVDSENTRKTMSNDLSTSTVSSKSFLDMLRDATSEKYGFLWIDDSKPNNARFRKGI